MASTDRDRYRRGKEIFQEAEALETSRRSQFVKEACAGDELLQCEVQALLSADDGLDDIFASSVSLTASQPEEIAGYRILELIGHGGMGLVYRAEQKHPRRTVALKVLHFTVAPPEVLRRFENEAHVLARLQHPGIAQVFEAATFEGPLGAQPFLAMEYIEGESLLEHARSQRLGLRERLELLHQICTAVAHAHQRSVIHRDLKPGNILVNAQGQAKVLDFGIARVTDADLRATTLLTIEGQLLGTVPYMSPEQAAGNSADLDLRSDVYSLGVVAYELLTGRLPYDVLGKVTHEAVRIIQSKEPSPASTTDRRLRGDVETILRHALDKDREQRYQSASELAADLRRFLNDEPVIARPPSAWYQLCKFTRRNRLLIGGVLGLLLVLMVASVVGFTLFFRADKQRRKADREARTALEATDFLVAMFEQVDPLMKRGEKLTAREILDLGTAKIQTSIQDAPLARARLLNMLGHVYKNMGLYREALPLLEEALRLRRTHLNAGDLDLAYTLEELAFTLGKLGATSRAVVVQTESLRILQAADPLQEFRVAEGRVNLGGLLSLELRFDQSEALLLLVLEQAEERGWTVLAGTALGSLSFVCFATGRYAEAEQAGKRCLAHYREEWEGDHPKVVGALSTLARTYQIQEKYHAAKRLMEEAVPMAERLFGRRSLPTADAVTLQALVLQEAGSLQRALPLYEEALEIRREYFGSEHRSVAFTLGNLGTLLHDLRRLDEAESYALDALEMSLICVGEDHLLTLEIQNNLGFLYRDMGRYEEAAEILEVVVEKRIDLLGKGHLYTCGSLDHLVVTYRLAGRPEDEIRALRDLIAWSEEVDRLAGRRPRFIARLAELEAVAAPDR